MYCRKLCWKKVRVLFLVSLCLCLLCFRVSAQNNVVTIIPFASQGISPGDAETFTEMFISEYANITKSDVADRSNFDAIAEQYKFQLTDWSNDVKVAKLGKAMNAEKIICGRLSVFGYVITLTVRTIDVNSTKILNSVNWKGNGFDELLDGMKNIIKELNGMYHIGGKGPGGGIVFYESEIGFPVQECDGTEKFCHYLEVSPVEFVCKTWCDCIGNSRDPFGTPTHYTYYMCNTETNEGLGSGKKNTQAILANHHESAAKICAEYFTETTIPGEWFLPSKIELDFLYKNLIETGIMKCSGLLWSSSQCDMYKEHTIFVGFDPTTRTYFDGHQVPFRDFAWGLSQKGVDSFEKQYGSWKGNCVHAVRAF